MIWKKFKDDNDELFFTKEYADTNLGLMINMDWFQPFLSSLYFVSVVYAIICNLPCTKWGECWKKGPNQQKTYF